MNFKLLIQYDGTDFHGWQTQEGLRTVQGELVRVLSLLDDREVRADGLPRGRDRLDHARVRFVESGACVRAGPEQLELCGVEAEILGPGRLVDDRLLEGVQVAGMREQLAAVLPDVEVLDGVAEAIPLDDAAVDAATVGQAFHWFDGDRALLEIRRIARPCCRLAVVYNRRRLENPLQAALDAILRPLHEQTPAHRGGRWRDAFARTRLWTAVEGAELPHVQLLDREGVVARAALSSFIAALPSERRAAVLNQVRAVVKRRAEPIELPYVCELSVWQQRPEAWAPASHDCDQVAAVDDFTVREAVPHRRGEVTLRKVEKRHL